MRPVWPRAHTNPEPLDHRRAQQVTTVVIAWSVLAACLLVATIFEFSAFGILSEAMTARLRVAILESVFRQEVGFHDDPAHTPGVGGGLGSPEFGSPPGCARLDADLLSR